MQEPSWAEGYVVDVGYITGYCRELAPAGLRFITLLGGVHAADTDQPFTYYELGCGNGYSSVLHAAANPGGQFFGVDFNPTHIHNAQKLAQDCGVENVRFLEKSFAELTTADLPDAEVVGLHGVYSWVSEENRRHIAEFIRRRLKPGGIAYVSYNCLPGLVQVAPLQRLLFEHAGLGSGPLLDRLRRSLDYAARLNQTGAQYFEANPLAKAWLTRIGKQDPRYLAHEYFNASWSPFYHADVVKELAAAKLNYVGSADILDNFEQFVLKPEMTKLIGEIGHRPVAETIKDFVRNQVFRRDVLTRGAPRASGPELEAMLGRTRFALARPRPGCRLKSATPAGEVTLQEEAYAPVLDALARAPMTFDELTRAPESAQLDRRRLRQAVFGMAALGNILPALPAAGEETRRMATARFNGAVLQKPIPMTAATMLASPVSGAGVAVGFLDRIFLNALHKESELGEYARKVIASGGYTLLKNGKPVENQEEVTVMIEERAGSFQSELLPLLHQLGVVK